MWKEKCKQCARMWIDGTGVAICGTERATGYSGANKYYKHYCCVRNQYGQCEAFEAETEKRGNLNENNL